MSDDAPISALRRMASMTDEQVTALTGVRAPDVHHRNKSDWKRGLEHFGLTPQKATKVGRHEGETPSLFLFSGDLASFDFADLMPLAFGLDEARASLVSARSEGGFARRARFRVIPPPASSARDAAHQGHYLARQVRAVLDEPLGPLTDIADRVEQQLCVSVRAAQFATRDLRAAAVRDADMGAAVVLVNTQTPDPRLVRVAIAHELCHLLFDPSGSRVILTLDRLPQGWTAERAENRARAFAAEFLAPRAGLIALLGSPDSLSDLDDARRVVQVAREHFCVSRELATWHLGNHHFITVAARDALLRSLNGSGASGQHGLEEVKPHAENMRRARASRAEASVRIAAIDQTTEELARAFLSDKVRDSQERPLDVAVELGRTFDDALDRGDHALGLALLTELDPRKMAGDTSSGFLGYVRVPCLALGGQWQTAYRSAAAKTVNALAAVWGWDPEDLADAATGLLG